jgi:hypothetical protein
LISTYGAQRDRHQHQPARAAVHHPPGLPPRVAEDQPAVLPAQVRVQVGEQPGGAARGELTGAVGDVRVEHRPDPRPVRGDEPIVGRAQFRRDRAQSGRRVRGEFGRGGGQVVAEDPLEADADLTGRGAAQGGEVVVQ